MLLDSKHYGQIRLLLLVEKKLPEPGDPLNLWMITGKPVLVISKESEIDTRRMFQYRDNVFHAAGIDEESAKRVLNIVYPESRSRALQVAEIILERLITLHKV